MAALPHTRAPVSGHSHLVLASLRRPPGPSPISRMRLGDVSALLAPLSCLRPLLPPRDHVAIDREIPEELRSNR
uniref:Uncharacterized protein n=1 Tax=Oryza sativa subsp. japonica TaxID=39947 RepID=Q69TW3_ORYSJ|nr:hypothetical protein [Oryza sativa Japonica Group]BAD35714.1 hypothetical protein [Oryza sativa Japonica Group]